jgi:hypothetical protein
VEGDVSLRADRCPPVPLETLYVLSSGTRGLFCIAAAEGRSMNPAGTFDKLGPGQRPVGVWIGKVHRDRILGTLKINQRRWRYAIQEWVDLSLAHRCQRSGVFLSLKPASICRRCGNDQTSAATTTKPVPLGGIETVVSTNERGNPLREHSKGEGMGVGSVDLSTPEASA